MRTTRPSSPPARLYARERPISIKAAANDSGDSCRPDARAYRVTSLTVIWGMTWANAVVTGP